ncbi:hypothetical protein MJO28_011719 [Puccinia striiformis f. sp. tritici]|uniref:Uncharacterized protein n=2 Tax=Puccinia striiformis TaxID=27350 RepID=A0A2S4UZ13_9BASI|nr:hypothetical protein MJO28_011719 [Puccinia striiformis f. sp. tritici]POW02435.1 hypothetical protein PSTT_11786 [Puccinia striiformis]
MTNSTDECVPGIDPGPSEIQQQGDLVRQGFERLLEKCTTEDGTRAHSRYRNGKAVSTDPVEIKKALLLKLEASLLPLLRQHLTALSDSLELSGLRNQPGPRLKLILNIQLALEHTSDQIKSALYTLCPERLDSVPYLTNDAHDEGAKLFRLCGLDELLTESVFNDMNGVLRDCSRLILQLGLSTEIWKYPDWTDTTRGRLERCTIGCQNGIDETIRWLSGYELDLVRQRWPDDNNSIGGSIADFCLWTNPANKIEQEKASAKILYQNMFVRYPPSEPACQLAQSLIPLMKLSRLFFKKLSNWELNTKRPSLFTKMSSDQLKYLDRCSRFSSDIIDEFQTILVLKPFPRVFPGDHLTKLANELNTHFQRTISLIVLYFLYKTSLKKWNHVENIFGAVDNSCIFFFSFSV